MTIRRLAVLLSIVMIALLPLLVRADDPPHVVASDSVAAGRFLVNYGGCNDCHTPQWNELRQSVPESARLVGSARGFTGPWGTSYPANLRVLFANMTEDQWLQLVQNPAGVDHPPMPWWSIQRLTLADQRALYAYIHGLGAAGGPTPAYAPPTH
jgi:hypothetical protein